MNAKPERLRLKNIANDASACPYTITAKSKGYIDEENETEEAMVELGFPVGR